MPQNGRHAGTQGPAPDSATGLRRVILSALRTRFYLPLLSEAGLGSPQALEREAPDLDLLRKLPLARLSGKGFSRSAFENPEIPPPSPDPLHWPLPAPKKAALLAPGFPQCRGVRVIRVEESARLRSFAPEALAGPVSELRRLVEPRSYAPRRLPRLTHSMLAFLTFPQLQLSRETRDLLWDAFGVPVFVQVLSPGGRLLAWECEAHDGYHILTENAVFENLATEDGTELAVTCLADLRLPVLRMAAGWSGRVTSDPCACGRMGQRLVGPRARMGRKPQATAASAACAAD